MKPFKKHWNTSLQTLRYKFKCKETSGMHQFWKTLEAHQWELLRTWSVVLLYIISTDRKSHLPRKPAYLTSLLDKLQWQWTQGWQNRGHSISLWGPIEQESLSQTLSCQNIIELFQQWRALTCFHWMSSGVSSKKHKSFFFLFLFLHRTGFLTLPEQINHLIKNIDSVHIDHLQRIKGRRVLF